MRFIKECFQRPPEEGKGPWPHRAAEPWRSMNKVSDREGVDELFQTLDSPPPGVGMGVGAPSGAALGGAAGAAGAGGRGTPAVAASSAAAAAF